MPNISLSKQKWHVKALQPKVSVEANLELSFYSAYSMNDGNIPTLLQGQVHVLRTVLVVALSRKFGDCHT